MLNSFYTMHYSRMTGIRTSSTTSAKLNHGKEPARKEKARTKSGTWHQTPKSRSQENMTVKATEDFERVSGQGPDSSAEALPGNHEE